MQRVLLHHRAGTRCLNGSVSQKSFLWPGLNPFYPLKCVLGAGENESESVRCLAFLSLAITEHPQRRSKKRETRMNRVVRLGCFSADYCFTPDPFYFYCLLVSHSFSTRLVCTYLLLVLLSFILSAFSVSTHTHTTTTTTTSSPILCHPALFLLSSHIHSPAAILVYLMSWQSGTVYRKWKINFD